VTVYVDDMRRRAQVGRGRPAIWSHLQADTTEELLEFTSLLGLDPKWIQKAGTVIEHFDVTETKRRLAVQLGAVEIAYGGEESRALIRRKMAERDAAKKESTSG